MVTSPKKQRLSKSPIKKHSNKKSPWKLCVSPIHIQAKAQGHATFPDPYADTLSKTKYALKCLEQAARKSYYCPTGEQIWSAKEIDRLDDVAEIAVQYFRLTRAIQNRNQKCLAAHLHEFTAQEIQTFRDSYGNSNERWDRLCYEILQNAQASPQEVRSCVKNLQADIRFRRKRAERCQENLRRPDSWVLAGLHRQLKAIATKNAQRGQGGETSASDVESGYGSCEHSVSEYDPSETASSDC